MWTVTGAVDGERRALDTRVVEAAEPPSLEQVRAAAASLPRSQRLLRYLDAELARTEDGSPFVRSFDAVQRWSARAASASSDDVALRGRFVALPEARGALGYFASPADARPSHPDSVVWHAHTLVVVSIPPGMQEVELEYQPEAKDAADLEWLTARYQTPAHVVEAVLDARTCRGSESLLVDHFRGMRRRGRSVVASIRGTADMLVGRVLYRITAVQPAPLVDLTYPGRLAAMRRQWPDVAQWCPDIGSLSAVRSHETAMVFIHGTLSCGVQSLKDLFPAAPPPFPVYRYEHDTFLRVRANGHELAALIASYIDAKRLLLVAHSRGGLVGRVTMAALPGHGVTSSTELLTFGAPHAGTPLVRVAKGLLNLLVKIGSAVVDGIPLMTHVAAAAAHVYDVSALPDGIAVMEEGAEALETMNDGPAVAAVRSWGSVFNPDTHASGFGIDVENVLTGAMRHIPHDLVVPSRSATAYGQRQPELACSHAGYFAQREVREVIMQTMAALIPVMATAEPSGGVGEGSRHIIAGGIVAPKRAVFAIHYRLAEASRLPIWFALPPTVPRATVIVSLRYGPDRTSAIMSLRRTGDADRSVTCEVRRVVDDSQPRDYPRREILAANGMTDVIEYRVMGRDFHMIDVAAGEKAQT